MISAYRCRIVMFFTCGIRATGPQQKARKVHHFFCFTLPKTNIAGWKIHHGKMVFTRKHGDFQGRAVSFREGNLFLLLGVEPKIGGFTPQIIHLFIGFSLIFTIHFGYHYFWKRPVGFVWF